MKNGSYGIATSDAVFYAEVGEGHFHRASASTTSLRGAFRAVPWIEPTEGTVALLEWLGQL